jgi:uncharacterized membrane protein
MEPFNGKLFGHPIHMMLVHFPAALLPVVAAMDLLIHLNVIAAFDLRAILVIGVAFGWLAAIFGFWDLVRIKGGSKAMTVALTHGGINALAVSGFTWALVMWMTDHVTALTLAIEIAGAMLILIGNKFGGDLVIRYFVGTHFERPLKDEVS